MTNITQTCAALDRHGVMYEFEEHPAVMTIDECRLHQVDGKGMVLKNLFLRDRGGTRTFMFCCHGHKRADLKKLAQNLGVSKLTFASPEHLLSCTGLTPGAVSPLGLIFDTTRQVTLAFDSDLYGLTDKIGVHPGENTATVFLKFDALVRFLEEIGAEVVFVDN